MNNRTRWLLTKLRLGWAFLAAGLTVSLAGIFIGLEYDYLPYNFRVITGLGILLLGIGISYLVRTGPPRKTKPPPSAPWWMSATSARRAFGPGRATGPTGSRR